MFVGLEFNILEGLEMFLYEYKKLYFMKNFSEVCNNFFFVYIFSFKLVFKYVWYIFLKIIYILFV